MKTIYFDSAATTFKKPPRVYTETDKAFRQYSANSGRGSHTLSVKAGELIYECREAIARLFGAEAENVTFTFNTTYALNMAIKGVAKRGDHFIISNLEHNSVTRPIQRLSEDKVITYDVFDAFCWGEPTPERIIADISSRIRSNTKCIVCTHTSNICSLSPPIYEIGKLCRERGITFIVDGAQGGGHVPIDIGKNNIDILCLPSHKGLYGPQGLGIMITNGKISPKSIIEGGSGINSLVLEMPNDPPEKYEAGTLPCHAIHGLRYGAEFVENYGFGSISKKETLLWDRLYSSLRSCDRVKIYDNKHKGSILLFNILGIDSSAVGRELSKKGICVRAGYHCAALAHKALDTHADGCGGAVRVSFSVFNTADEVDTLTNEILKIAERTT